MLYKLYLNQQEELLSKPETGMGYQLIEAQSTGEYNFRKYIVLNAQLVIDNDPSLNESLHKVKNLGFIKSLESAPSRRLNNIKVLNKNELSNTFEEKSSKSSTGAKDAPPQRANGSDYFVRLSAFHDDRRIDRNNHRLLPGSYTTTSKDYVVCLRRNDDPLERYALPNDEPIQWAFYIRPTNKDYYQFGIVQADFGKRGGGEECYFDNGTSFDTFIFEKPYGK